MTSDLNTISIPVRILLPAAIYKRLHRAAEAHSTTVGALTVELVRRALKDAAAPTPVPRELQTGLPEAVLNDPNVQKAIARASAAWVLLQKRQESQELRAERVEKINDLHARGLSDGQIGAQLRLTPQRVSQLRKQLGLSANFGFADTSGPSEETLARVAELYAQGLSDNAIARTLNISPGTAGSYRTHLGLPARSRGYRTPKNEEAPE